MITPEPAEVQTMCRRLHAEYSALTKRPTPMLPGLARLWWDLLSSAEYAYDVEKMSADLAHLVRYLLMGIRDAKRNDGCLKLLNLLQPERWWEDLGEARVKLSAAKPKAAVSHVPAPGEQRAPVAAGADIAAKLRQFREGGLRT